MMNDDVLGSYEIDVLESPEVVAMREKLVDAVQRVMVIHEHDGSARFMLGDLHCPVGINDSFTETFPNPVELFRG